jgi:hypothetical protein
MIVLIDTANDGTAALVFEDEAARAYYMSAEHASGPSRYGDDHGLEEADPEVLFKFKKKNLLTLKKLEKILKPFLDKKDEGAAADGCGEVWNKYASDVHPDFGGFGEE